MYKHRYIHTRLHPHDNARRRGRAQGVCMTASRDGTVRTWDLEHCARSHVALLHMTSHHHRARRVPVIKAVYAPASGQQVVLAGDGRVRIWGAQRGARARRTPDLSFDAHVDGGGDEEAGTGVDVAVACDGLRVVTRGGRGDDSVKVWDLRALRVHV